MGGTNPYTERTAMRKIINLIDGGYFYKVRRRLGVGRHDLCRLAAFMARDCLLEQTTFYNCLPSVSDESPDEVVAHYDRTKRYFDHIAQQPQMIVKLGKLARAGWSRLGQPCYVQKMVDVSIGVDIAVAATKRTVTDIALLAGDSDFVPAVLAAQAEGVRVHLFHDVNASRDLILACDSATQLHTEELFAL
jgi:uncharacterized LabA/DUF88 family protein